MADVHELLDTWIANVKDEELLAELNTMKEQGAVSQDFSCADALLGRPRP